MNKDEYYIGIAFAVRRKANCLGRRVGAIIVKKDRIISTGYNGTPEGWPNCMDGGCLRCKNRETYKSSVGYDVCICVHAEQNALITAARFGNAVEDSVIYSTLRPCFDCTKAALQAKVDSIRYVHNWEHPLEDLREQYEQLQKKFPEEVRQLNVADPDPDWGNGKSTAPR
jgi:dCMP deaminase